MPWNFNFDLGNEFCQNKKYCMRVVLRTEIVKKDSGGVNSDVARQRKRRSWKRAKLRTARYRSSSFISLSLSLSSRNIRY